MSKKDLNKYLGKITEKRNLAHELDLKMEN